MPSLADHKMDVRLRTCHECGMLLDNPGEFHPQAFCVWKKAGLDPWKTLLWVNERLGLDMRRFDERQPPLVRNLDHLRAAIAPERKDRP